MDETVAAKPTAEWDAKYAGFLITTEHFTRIATFTHNRAMNQTVPTSQASVIHKAEE